MAEIEKLTRKRRIRGGHRASTKRTLSLAKEALESPEVSAVKVRQYLQILREKMALLKTLDAEILDLVTEEGEIMEEIEQADIVRENIESSILDIEEHLVTYEQRITPTQPDTRASANTRGAQAEDTSNESEIPVQTSPSSRQQPSTVARTTEPEQNRECQTPQTQDQIVRSRECKVRLPKLTLKKFDGDVTAWISFWDSFESSIHLNTDLTDIDKFNYLRSLLEFSALEAISGLTLSSTNYTEAVAILKKRFGNKQSQITKHMEALLELDVVTSSRDLVALRKLYDRVESHVRCLKSLGVTSSSYGNLLSSILMKKIPSDISLIVSRETIKANWDLDSMMKVIEQELEARERAVVESCSGYKKPSKEPPTASALFTEGTSATCCYCGGPHQPHQCGTVPSVDQRKMKLRQTGRCFVCLKRGHLGRVCRSSVRCSSCNARHHSSICTASTSASSSHSKPSQSPRAPVRSTIPTTDPAPQAPVLSMYVSTKMPILLQTAKARASNPLNSGLSTQIRVILDSGSQRSYMTNRLKEVLQLQPERTETMLVKTFGSEEQRRYTCDIVSVVLDAKNGSALDLQIVSVPLICEPLSGQPVVCAIKYFPQLTQLDLADSATCADDLEVDILIGCDYYWRIVTGNLIRSAEGLTALETAFGWVLSGPIRSLPCRPCHGSYVTQLNTSFALHVSHDTMQYEDMNLEKQLKQFWDLETLGIRDEEPSLYDKFLETVSYDGTRYQVRLPWKELHATLPNNFDLSQRRLSGLLKRLKHDPEILQEYDTIIRNQIESNVVEVVEAPFFPTTSKVHYIPHHPVIRRDKTTSKLRIVYDASAKTNGASLNDCLYAGPAFGQCILDILLRFRVHKVAFAADIEKAFLMVSIAKEDRDVLRFMWIDSIEKSLPQIVVLRFTRVAFGVSSSPFLLNATIRHHMTKHSKEDPAFVEKFLRSIYVDDIVSGADDTEEAYQSYTRAKHILRDGGFNLRKLISNQAILRDRTIQGSREEDIPATGHPVAEEDGSYSQNTLGNEQLSCVQGQQKVLGINWNLVEDQLSFDVTFVMTDARTGANKEEHSQLSYSNLRPFWDNFSSDSAV